MEPVIIFFVLSLVAWFFIILLISTSMFFSFHMRLYLKVFIYFLKILYLKMRTSKFWFLRCIFRHPVASELEEWISTKDYSNNELPICPKWHIPNDDEVHFANELLDLHFKAALDDLLTMCQTKIHSDSGK